MRHPTALLAPSVALAAPVARAATGEDEACRQVVALAKDRVTLKHLSGRYAPEWSDTPIAPGTTDECFDSDFFREQNPGKPPLTQIRAIFETVATCHEPS